MEIIISDELLSEEEIFKAMEDKASLFNDIKRHFSEYSYCIINMHRGGHVFKFNYDEDHLLFNLKPGYNYLMAMVRVEPRVIKNMKVDNFSSKGKEAFNKKKFCQTGYWIYLELENQNDLNDLYYIMNCRILNLDRVNKKNK